ncbi:hypothetical protein IWZ00DRAFT_528569 [Phyllosticta capitalensis]|uniref:uncharacterized protein n=1 Tax=Phyllosticta capitalensis TaxID=121624 RepID=UPI00312F08F2
MAPLGSYHSSIESLDEDAAQGLSRLLDFHSSSSPKMEPHGSHNDDNDDDSVIASFDRCSLGSDEPLHLGGSLTQYPEPNQALPPLQDHSTSPIMALNGSHDDVSTRSSGGNTDQYIAQVEELTWAFAGQEPKPTEEPSRKLADPRDAPKLPDLAVSDPTANALLGLWLTLAPLDDKTNEEIYKDMRKRIKNLTSENFKACEELVQAIKDQNSAVRKAQAKLESEKRVLAEVTSQVHQRIARNDSLLDMLPRAGYTNTDEELERLDPLNIQLRNALVVYGPYGLFATSGGNTEGYGLNAPSGGAP